MFVIFTASSTPNVLPMTAMMKLDVTKLSEVEEDFSYGYDIYEIGFGFEDISTRETD